VRAAGTVRALVRPASDASRLESRGVQIARGDMLDVDSLVASMTGVDAVITTAAGYTAYLRWRNANAPPPRRPGRRTHGTRPHPQREGPPLGRTPARIGSLTKPSGGQTTNAAWSALKVSRSSNVAIGSISICK
jgi:hypothetical protein